MVWAFSLTVVNKLNRRVIFAYPPVTNEPSNAMCKKLGFAFIEATESEYPPKSGLKLRCNIWRLDLGGYQDR